MSFSKDKTIERLNVLIKEFEEHKHEAGPISLDTLAMLYWLKYGSKPENIEIQHIVNRIPFDK